MFYSLVFISLIHQHESAIGIHILPPSWTSLSLPTQPTHLNFHRALGFSSLHHIANSHWLSILHMYCKIVYMFPYCFLNLSHLLLPSLCPQVFSLCLHFHCCLANRFISKYHLSVHGIFRARVLEWGAIAFSV